MNCKIPVKKLALLLLLFFNAGNISSDEIQPFGAAAKMDWWRFSSINEQYLALLMLASFSGVVYFLWRGFTATSKKQTLIKLMSATGFFLLFLAISFNQFITH